MLPAVREYRLSAFPAHFGKNYRLTSAHVSFLGNPFSRAVNVENQSMRPTPWMLFFRQFRSLN
jgi:hypothetical protein